IMDEARIVAEGSPRELIEKYVTREVVEVRFGRADDPAAAVPRLKEHGERVEVLADRVLVYSHDGDRTMEEVEGNGLSPASVFLRRSSLEDVLLMLTGRTLED